MLFILLEVIAFIILIALGIALGLLALLALIAFFSLIGAYLHNAWVNTEVPQKPIKDEKIEWGLLLKRWKKKPYLFFTDFFIFIFASIGGVGLIFLFLHKLQIL